MLLTLEIVVFILVLATTASANPPPFRAHIVEHVRSNIASDVQQQAATEVLGRIIPNRAHQFEVIVDGGLKPNSFNVLKSNKSAKVVITASSGVAATKGFYHYLKYSCGCHVSWDGDQLDLPEELPNVNVSIQAPSSIIYYQNVCTWSYSFTWWTWTEWRRHIDWMALQGITLSLAPFQEDIWSEVYREYNLTQQDIDDHLSGPGFFAWQRMGNIRGWGGPLTKNFINFSRTLQTQVVREMRRLGMVLALPAFAGHLPVQFKQLFPTAMLTPVEVWNKFPQKFASPLFLDPTDPLFLQISEKFLTKVISRYGTNHIYFSDPFNEIQPKDAGAEYLASAASGIYEAMIQVDPLAVWLLQGWMLVKNPFWTDPAIKAFLTAVPIGRMLVLDLQSEQFPQYFRTRSYHGQPFVWCTLSNFGGTRGMLGSVDLIYDRIREARKGKSLTMIGTGITPEGINQNYGVYEFTLEMGWNTNIKSTEKWFRTYASVRYGNRDDQRLLDAWSTISSTVYSFRGLQMMRGKYVFNQRPSLKLLPWILTVNDSDNVTIIGSSGVAATKGFYHYLKYACGCQVSWNGDQLNLPTVLPKANVTIQAPSSVTYYQNVCTWSYSFTWWTWTEWRRHIDWMALQGITLSLAPFQEGVWSEVYREYNLTQQDIDDHLSGPGFFAWQRMGNIRGWGGPLTKNFINFSRTLQTQVVREMRRLGMVLALPAFAGHLPVQFKQLFPTAMLTPADNWNGFQAEYSSPLFLDPTDPLFLEIGQKFLTKMVARYGTNHIYFADPFNEINPRSSNVQYLASAASGIYKAMTEVDSLAVWLLQNWMFVLKPFWQDPGIEAFLTAVPIGRILVLDLQSEQFPQYSRTKSYYGQPFVWCTLGNFGGTLGLIGSVDLVFNRIREARNSTNLTMIGTGITPEGINMNYAVYDFTLEMGWNRNIKSSAAWFKKYAASRYGNSDGRALDAWSIFRRTVYSFEGDTEMHGLGTFNREPSLGRSAWVWYNETFFNEGVQKLLDANLTNQALYQYDVVDVTRQFLQNTACRLYLNITEAYAQRNLTSLQHASGLYLQLMKDMDRLLRTDEHFLLGRWLESAKALGETSLEQQKYEYNARNQITLWGPNGEIKDYANKQWSGVVKDFFLPRWRMFLRELISAVKHNRPFNEMRTRNKIFHDVELPFCTDRKLYPTEPKGDSLKVARELFIAWSEKGKSFRQLPFNV